MAFIPTLRCSRIAASVAFYTTVLGFELAEGDPRDGDPSMVVLARDGHRLFLSSHAGDGRPGQPLVVTTDDVEGLFATFRQRGLRVPGDGRSPVHERPIDQTWGTREFYVDDPDGNTLRFVQGLNDSRELASSGPWRQQAGPAAGGGWDPGGYLTFAEERTRPSHDLVARIAVPAPATVVDLGCGPGNGTEVLARRWPSARVVGVDHSPEMIEAARAAYPAREWILGGIESWAPDTPVDVVFSNAALQWLPDHRPLVQRLFGRVARGGALAFQVPSADYALVRRLIVEVAGSGPWAARMTGPLMALTMAPASSYYDWLAPLASRVDLWETEYHHVLGSPDEAVAWMSSTGLRPFLAVLDGPDDTRAFTEQLLVRTREAYPRRADGKVLFPFKRTFVIAYA